jgi:glycosyltransferase involved in cell wall biosynthesis
MLRINETMDSTYNIICFGFLPWSHMWKRNQSMMAEMSKCDFVRRVIFVNPTISLRNHFFQTKKSFSVSIGTSSHVFPWKISPKITVYQPMSFLPLKTKFLILKKIEDHIILRFIQHLNCRMPYILFMNCPNIASHNLLDRILEGAALSIFDFSDDFSELGYAESTKNVFRQNALKYAGSANVVLAVNEHVKDKYFHVNPNIHVIRNATNYENFNQETFRSIDVLERIKRNGSPIIGYSGIANMGRIDGDMLDFLVDQRPDWQFVFVGPAHEYFVERYSTCHNVHILESVAYQDLPCYLQYFNVAIVPFQVNENTKGNDLLKLYDYLAMGKPVVSTNIGGAVDLKEVIRIAQTPQEFLKRIEEFLKNHCCEDDVAHRKRHGLKNSWRARIGELEVLVKRSLQTKK